MNTNHDCYQDILNGVTIDNAQVINGYNKRVILTNPLTISGNVPSNLVFDAPSAYICGSAADAPAARGTLNLAGSSVFSWAAGTIENLTVNVSRSSTPSAELYVKPTTLSRVMIGSDINVDGLLNWTGGNVSVTNSAANSNININSVGEFDIAAADATWGGPAGNSYFKVKNKGMTRLNAQGTAHIVGDFSNYGTVRLDVGILDLGGKAEQWSGTTELHDNTTIKASGTGRTLNIFYGSIIGKGTVDGNLALGFDPNVYGMMYSGATIDPGFTTTDPNTEEVTHTPGKITITLSFEMFDVGTMMVLDITSGGYDQVAVTGGYAALNGTVTVTKTDDYQPGMGTDLPLVTAASGITRKFISDNYYGDAFWGNSPPLVYGLIYEPSDDNPTSFNFIVARGGS